jgi:hypothetical protein
MSRTLHYLLIFLLVPALAGAQDRPQPADQDLSRELEGPISRGLAYLARQQQPDGSIQNREQERRDNAANANSARFTGPKIPLTGLSLIAFLAAGHTPDNGKHGLVVRNALEYLVKACPDDGYYGNVDGSRMYGHAIATLALAEAYGTETDAKQRKRVRAALQKAVKVLLAAQNAMKDEVHRGGWRYEPASTDSDLSVTGWCALALRAAHDAGIHVPKDSADRAADYILRCYHPEKKGFSYQPGGDPTPGVTASAVLNLHLLYRSSRQEAATGAQFLLDNRIDNKTEYPCHARYYAAQAAFQSGGGEVWTRIWRRTRTALLEEGPTKQEADGSWPQTRTANEPGRTYSTAMAVMTLSIPLRLLPTYQR